MRRLFSELISSFVEQGEAVGWLAERSLEAADTFKAAAGDVGSMMDELSRRFNSPEANYSDREAYFAGRDLQNKYIRSYDIGTDYVPSDGLAYLHKGEAVLTPQENAARRAPTTITIPVSVGGKHLETIIVDVADRHIVRREKRGVTGRTYG